MPRPGALAALPFYRADQVTRALDWQQAIAALRAALTAGLDPENEPQRTNYPVPAGQFLLMPSAAGERAGVKLATVAPGNPDRGMARIQALYVLFDANTLTPVATLDGTALTALRTPAVSALATDLVAPADASRLLVFGCGPQAYGHVHALRTIRPVDSVQVVGRNPRRAATLVDRLRNEGIAAATAEPDDIEAADLVACCTTSREPLFDGSQLPEGAIVVAMGSHEPDAREVDAETVRRCGVLVESRRAATAEAGDVVQAVAEGAIAAADLVTLASVVRGETSARPRLIKIVGMGWEDLAVATAVLDAIEG